MKRILLLSLSFFLTINIINSQVVFNEIMYNPLGADGGFVPGEVGEWIELYGPSGADISCYVITDGDWTITIPDGTTIPADNFFVIGDAMWANTPNPSNGSVAVDLDTGTCGCTTGSNVPGLTNSGEYVVLFDENQNFLDGINYNDPNASNLPSGNLTTAAVGACSSVTVNIGAIAGSIFILPGPDLNGGISRDADGTGSWGYITPTEATPGESNLFSLPVELISFDAYSYDSNQSIELKWATASESKNDYFSVQHSRDGMDFRNIGQIDGIGFSNEINIYNFIHKNVLGGQHYYRLQQIDLDMTMNYSKIITINLRNPKNDVSVFPNPAFSKINIQFDAPILEKADCQLSNLNGQIVFENSFEKGENIFSLDLNNYPKGIYYLKIKTKEELFFKKIIKQ